MTTSNPYLRDDSPDEGDGFSIMLGGPLFQLFRRLHLSGNTLEMAGRRIVVIALLAWLPLLILSAAQGLALGQQVTVPFLKDVEAHVRFLLVVPLLVAAELNVHRRLRFVVRQLLERELIPKAAKPRLVEAVESTMRLRNSLAAEVGLIVFIYVVGVNFVWRRLTVLAAATWYATPGPGGLDLTLAGMWYAWFSVPLTQFLLIRWYYRLFLWARFLWKVSRIELRLAPTHPDRCGGLGFLSLAAFAFTPLAVAHGAMLSGWMAGRIFLQQAALLDFKFGIAALVVFLLILFLGPFFLFTPQLAHVTRQGERDYGPLAERYAHEFEDRRVRGGAPADEPLLGGRDVLSLAAISNVYGVVRSMRVTPITRQAIIQIAVATLIPIAPLALTMMPLDKLVKLILGMLV